MSGFSGIGAISSVQDIISITRTIRAAMVFAQRQLRLRGRRASRTSSNFWQAKSFKSIPIQPANLAFVQEAK